MTVPFPRIEETNEFKAPDLYEKILSIEIDSIEEFVNNLSQDDIRVNINEESDSFSLELSIPTFVNPEDVINIAIDNQGGVVIEVSGDGFMFDQGEGGFVSSSSERLPDAFVLNVLLNMRLVLVTEVVAYLSDYIDNENLTAVDPNIGPLLYTINDMVKREIQEDRTRIQASNMLKDLIRKFEVECTDGNKQVEYSVIFNLHVRDIDEVTLQRYDIKFGSGGVYAKDALSNIQIIEVLKGGIKHILKFHINEYNIVLNRRASLRDIKYNPL